MKEPDQFLRMLATVLAIVMGGFLLMSLHFEVTIDANGTKHMSIDFSRERGDERPAKTMRPSDDETEKLFDSNQKVEQA